MPAPCQAMVFQGRADARSKLWTFPGYVCTSFFLRSAERPAIRASHCQFRDNVAKKDCSSADAPATINGARFVALSRPLKPVETRNGADKLLVSSMGR